MSIKKWDISSGDLVSNFLGHIGDIATIVLENTHLFSGGAEKSILMWDVDSVSTVRFYTGSFIDLKLMFSPKCDFRCFCCV